MSFQHDFGYVSLTIPLLVMEENRSSRCEDVGYKQIHSERSKKIAIPDQPPAVNTINPSPLPSEKFSQGGPIIREISHSNGTSIRTVALAPPHMRNSSGLRSNFQPVHLNPRPVQLNTQPAATVSE